MDANQTKDDVKDWKDKAIEILKGYYLSFGGLQWHEFDRFNKEMLELLRVKISYAMFGPPTDDADDVESAYSDGQKKKAGEILKLILKVHDDSPARELCVGFIFIPCKQDDTEFTIPLFSVYVGGRFSGGDDLRHYVDTQCRVYKNWDDWKNNNRLPMLEYAYPKPGYFRRSGGSGYEFDETLDPDVEFGKSPQCNRWSRILRLVDGATGVASFSAGIVGVVACFTPLAPVVLTGAAVTGVASAGYGAVRGINRLVDKGRHGESLADVESLTLWLSIAATPLHFASSAVNSTLSLGAQQGRIFSSSMRTFATILNFTTLGLDSMMLGFGLANLIKKAAKKELTTLDVLQFSMSVFFFTNTLMQPKVASSIIRKAQQQHFDRHLNSMTDAEAKAAFQKFVDQNGGQGSIADRSKIVRTVNKMDNPDAFFKGVGQADVAIGGRKGRTVLVADSHGYTTRINPNRVILSQDTNQLGLYKFNRDYNRLKKCYGKNPDEVELNGQEIFRDMNDLQKRRIGKAFGGSARSFDKDIVATAHTVAESMGYTNVDELMSVIEIVAAEVKGKTDSDLVQALNRIGGAGKDSFIEGIQQHIAEATRCAENAGLIFDNPLTAVYHYRKHGQEFPREIMKFGNRVDVYLGPVRDNIFNQSNLRERCTLQGGIVREIYATNGDRFGVITSTPDGQKISTMFYKPECNQEFLQNLAEYLQNANYPIEPVKDIAHRLARFLGFRAMHIYIIVDGKETPFDQCVKMDPRVHEHIARLLTALQTD